MGLSEWEALQRLPREPVAGVLEAGCVHRAGLAEAVEVVAQQVGDHRQLVASGELRLQGQGRGSWYERAVAAKG